MKYTFRLIISSVIVIVILDSCSSKNKILTKEEIIELKIDSVLSKMTLVEKIGQTSQRGTSSRSKTLSEDLKQAVREGRVGSAINVMKTEFVDELQRIAVNESPNGIPLVFARDVIHGFKTIFPIPLGQAATWNPELVENGARIAAIEASSKGIRWTFAPMLDISRDPRWGRIAESAGEDPYLTTIMGKAYTHGFQGDDLSNPASIAACAKHLVGYGAAEGGRDYNTASIHDQSLHNTYLRPFKGVVDEGIATVMTSFNELNGVPASANKYVIKETLKDSWNFKGFVVSDWNSILEMTTHGYSENTKEAAFSAANAGLDMEMTSTTYETHLKDLIQEGRIRESALDDLVRNILRIKFKLGLFESPDYNKNDQVLYKKEHLEASKQTAIESMVLLKNDLKILPLKRKTKIALIGPMADAPLDQLGTWTFDGDKNRSITPLTALKEGFGKNRINYVQGLTYSRDESEDSFSSAITAAKNSDVIVFCAGEEAILSGEAHSRSNINLPGKQEALIKRLSKTKKPIVLVIMAGRPITITNIIDDVDAILFAWHPGTMAGPAVNDLLIGKAVPSGRLPVSWPKSVGQIPIYYNHKNTGRPPSEDSYVSISDIPIGAWQSSLGNTSHYLDDGYEPLFPFGFGLSYSTVDYSNFKLSKDSLKIGESIQASIDITNTGSFLMKEVVQLYMQDEYASITRPVKELLQFDKISLKPNETKTVSFEINTDELSFYNLNKTWVTEPGTFKFWISKHAEDGKAIRFKVYE